MQHFLFSAAARTLSLKAVFRMGEDAAYETSSGGRKALGRIASTSISGATMRNVPSICSIWLTSSRSRSWVAVISPASSARFATRPVTM
jgi:hypothetical protein